MNAPSLSRREFAAALGGIVISFSLAPRLALGQDKPTLPGSLNGNRMLDAWLRINPDGSATVITGKVELGQGIITALAQIAAEELDLPLERIKMISGDTGQTPNEGQTAGSQSIEASGTALRMAGAEARSILLDLAAKRLGVAADTLTVSDGVITGRDGRKVGYGELAGEVDLHREATAKVAPKPPAEHKIVGKPIPRRDIPAKVTGGAAYVQDIRLPGMLHGRVVRPPRYGAKLESFDEAAVKALPGVTAVVRDGSFLGVVAAREEQAIKARDALKKSARWSGGSALPEQGKIYEHLMSLATDDKVISDKQAPLPEGAKRVEATYHRPYMAHASIGPSCAVAQVADGKVTAWTHSQGVFPLRATVAKALDMSPSAIRCIHAEGSGCYGHNGADDVALDAVLLARATGGRPVRVQWMRDDEFMWEPYGPAMVMRAAAALKDGRIVDWSYDVFSNTHGTRPGDPDGVNLLASWYLDKPKPPGPPRMAPQPAGAGDRNAIPLYDLPRQRITNHLIKEMPLRVSALRTLGAYANVFAIESFRGGAGRSGRVPPRASQGSARQGGDRSRRQGRRLDAGPEGQRQWRTRHRVCEIQDAGHLCGGRRRSRARSRQRPDQGAARLCGGGFRSDHQSRRPYQPDRGRHRAVHQLDAARGGALRQDRHPVPELGQLPDPDHERSAQRHHRAHRPAERALARGRRGGAGADRSRHRQRVRGRHRQAHPRPAVAARTGQGGAGIVSSGELPRHRRAGRLYGLPTT
jgi:nicotinate dehydrogenase subunit B